MPDKIKLSSLINVKDSQKQVGYQQFFDTLKPIMNEFNKDGNKDGNENISNNICNPGVEDEMALFLKSGLAKPIEIGVSMNVARCGDDSTFSIKDYITGLYNYLGGKTASLREKERPLQLHALLDKITNDPVIKKFIVNDIVEDYNKKK